MRKARIEKIFALGTTAVLALALGASGTAFGKDHAKDACPGKCRFGFFNKATKDPAETPGIVRVETRRFLLPLDPVWLHRTGLDGWTLEEDRRRESSSMTGSS